MGARWAAGASVLLLASSCSLRRAPKPYVPARENLEARSTFRDAKFGLFFNWGLFSVLREGERVMDERALTAAEYEALAGRFAAERFDADAWADLARAAGAQYLVATAKHHDGFSMFDSKATKFDVLDAAPLGRDTIGLLAEACRRQNLGVMIYYSLLDWHDPDYTPLGRTGLATRRPAGGRWKRYMKRVERQLGELTENYGPIDGIWLDGTWDKPAGPWRLDRLYREIHKANPATLITNDHGSGAIDGEDVLTYALEPGGGAPRGWSGLEAEGLPIQAIALAGTRRGYDARDVSLRPVREIIQNLVASAGRGENYTLVVNPTPEGEIPSAVAARLARVGEWMRENGDSILGTRAGPIAPGEWGSSTAKDGKIFIHYMIGHAGELSFPSRIGEARAAYLFGSGAPIDVTLSGDRYVIDIPQRLAHQTDTIIVIETRPEEADIGR